MKKMLADQQKINEAVKAVFNFLVIAPTPLMWKRWPKLRRRLSD